MYLLLLQINSIYIQVNIKLRTFDWSECDNSFAWSFSSGDSVGEFYQSIQCSEMIYS